MKKVRAQSKLSSTIFLGDVQTGSRGSRFTTAPGPPDPTAKPAEPAIPEQRTSSPFYEQPLFTSSSEGQASLQEIWRLLDNEESFRSPSPDKTRPRSPRRHVSANSQVPDHIPVHGDSGSDGFTVKGQRSELESKPAVQRPGLSKKAAGKTKVKLGPKKGKVRNYNLKSD